MVFKRYFFLLFFFTSISLNGQFFIKEYELEISNANHFMKSAEYDSAGIAFDKALLIVRGNYPFAVYYFEAAKCWSMAGEKSKAFQYLDLFEAKGWLPIEKILSDSMLTSLHTDSRWTNFVNDIELKQKRYGEVKRKLEIIGHQDQVLRKIKQCIGKDSMDLDYYYSLRERDDIENLAKVESIIEEYGWLGMSKIGDRANDILWRVVHHATPDVRKKYLPYIEDSVRKGETKPNNLALLEDRMLIDMGLPQKYGSQFVTIKETGENKVITTMDPENINQRRNAIGLSQIEDYLSLCGIKNVSIQSLSDPSTLAYMKRDKPKESK